MPFEDRTMAASRLSLVEEIKLGTRSLSEICRCYRVSRPTAYKWLRRVEAGDVLSDKSRAPLFSPTRTCARVEALIVATRNRYPCWGGRKIKAYLERRGEADIPSASTVIAILQRHGLISREASLKATPYKRFEMSRANDLWQLDFKGHFAMSDGTRCHPLTVIDDMSRFSLCISAKGDERLFGVKASFLRLFHDYGLPSAVLSDNGPPWGTGRYRGFTKFDIFMMDYGILPLHGRPLHPQTQGKAERFHRTLKRELLSRVSLSNLFQAQRAFDVFRREYNEVRPHCALDYGVPAERYIRSNKLMPKQILRWEYPQHYEVRNVRKDGYLSFKGLKLLLSEAFSRCEVAFVETHIDGVMAVIYRNFRIAAIDLKCGEFIFKKVTKLKKKEKSCSNDM